MGRHVEPLAGGLVTDRDPALLSRGQIAYMRNLVYLGSQSLRTPPGRAQWGTIDNGGGATGGVWGMRDMQFDNGNHYLVLATQDRYATVNLNASTPPSDPVTATFIDGIVSGKTFDAVQYGNTFIFLNGEQVTGNSPNGNMVAYLSATSTSCYPSYRPHGLLPVNAAPYISATATAWALANVTGYYEYWTTEVYKYTQDGVAREIESGFSGDTAASFIEVTSSNMAPVIYRPELANSVVTHWRVYRSPRKDNRANVKFPAGFRVFDADVSATSFIDTTTFTSSASSFPASAVSVTQSRGTGYTTNGFTSGYQMTADDGVYALATGYIASARSTAFGENTVPVIHGLYGFNFPDVLGGIRGIKVEVQGYVVTALGTDKTVEFGISVGRKSSDSFPFHERNYKFSKSGTITATSSASPQTVTLGLDNDAWSSPGSTYYLTDDDFTKGNFYVTITRTAGDAETGFITKYPKRPNLRVDYVKAYVYWGGTRDSTVVFPTVVYNQGDTKAQVVRNMTPPRAKTGDLFQDCLVTNDEENKSVIRYSYPGQPDYFPPTYFIDFETKANDVVQAVRAVNNKLIVGLDNQLWRVNYLPSEADSSFDRGVASDQISGQYGIVNHMCCCPITIEGQAETLAFVSNYGIHTTDGFNIVTRSKNQDWSLYIAGASSQPLALVNDVANKTLRFYYQYSATEQFCLWASYDRADIDGEGNFKFSGPVCMQNNINGVRADLETAWNVQKADGTTQFYMGYSSATGAGGGTLWYEKEYSGTNAIPSTVNTSVYRTRKMYLNGLGGEFMLDDLYGYCGDYSGTFTLSYTVSSTKTNDVNPQTISKSIIAPGGALHRISPRFMCESVQVQCEFTATTPVGQEYVIVNSKNLGLEDSGL